MRGPVGVAAVVCRGLQEAYLQICGDETAPATALTCRLMVNSLRWAAGLAADGSNGTSFRLAMFNNPVSSTTITNLKTAAVRDTERDPCRAAATDAAGVLRGMHHISVSSWPRASGNLMYNITGMCMQVSHHRAAQLTLPPTLMLLLLLSAAGCNGLHHPVPNRPDQPQPE